MPAFCISWLHAFTRVCTVSVLLFLHSSYGGKLERQWMCIKSEEILHNKKSYKSTTCRIPQKNDNRTQDQREGFHCVQETPDAIKEVEQSSYGNFSRRNAVIDSDPNSCTRTQKKAQQVFILHLKNVQIVKYAQVLTNTGSFSSGEHPGVSVYTTNHGDVSCDLCSLVYRDSLIRWSYFCPEGVLGDVIHVRDKRKYPEHFQLCTIHLFLQYVPTTTTPLPTKTTPPMTTTTTREPMTETPMPWPDPEAVSTQLPVTDTMIGKRPSHGEGSLLPIVLGSLAGVLLSILLVVCLVKKPILSRRPQVPPEVLPENHIYEDVSTMLRESVQPDILQEAGSHIYAEPQDLASPIAKENEIYEECPDNPETTPFLDDGSGLSDPIVDEEETKSVDNEIYAVD